MTCYQITYYDGHFGNIKEKIQIYMCVINVKLCY